MKKKLFFPILICLFLPGFFLFGQKSSSITIFSDYSVLEKQIHKLKSNPDSALYYVNIYIAKAKKEKDFDKLFWGYDRAVRNTKGIEQIKYGDSCVTIAVKKKDNDLIGEAFIALGQTYMGNELYKDALGNTISGLDYFLINNNPYLIHTAQYNIADIKKYIEDYGDAQDIYKDCLRFFRDHHEKIKDTDYTLYYIYSLLSLIDTNSCLQDFEENPKLIQEGIAFTSQNKIYSEYLPYFISSKGIDTYYHKDYPNAIKYFNQSLSSYSDRWKHLTDKFYLGMSYQKLGKQEEAFPYFQEIEKEYTETGKLDPEFRPALEGLLNYYIAKKDSQQQLYYIDQLLAFDKASKETKTYLSSKISKEYDKTALLLLKKNIGKTQLYEKIGAVSAVVILLALVIFILIKRKNQKKEPAPEITENSSPKIQPSSEKTIENQIDFSAYKPMNKETVMVLLDKLAAFEESKSFTKSGLKLYDLAEEFGTNEKYLSKVISISKNKTFNLYLSDLRLDYFQNLRGNITNERNIKSLAEKAGFENYSVFFKAYKERFSENPTEIVEENSIKG